MPRRLRHIPSMAAAFLVAGHLPAAADFDSWNPFPGGASRPIVGAVPAGPAPSPGGQIAATKLATKAPAFLDGGGRPSISPQAPPQVAFSGYATGSIVIDHQSRALYYVTSGSTAYRYPISVGREGFGWRGTQTVSRVASWPDWRPPAEMRERDPNLPQLMSGGVRNPLGAKALYLGNTLYRIHGTNDARTIGYAASSGCFRMMNAHVTHLATLAGVGTKVHVVSSASRNVASSRAKNSGG